jgi:fumarate reductase flavoprotein subunit
VNAAQREPWEIWVDADGRRFVDEATLSPFVREQALMARPGLRMASVWDQSIFEAAPPVIGPDWTRQDMVEEAERGRWLNRCDTLDELADRLEVDGAGLASTVADWNAGVDPFDRSHCPLPITQPPFWGVTSVGGMLLSRGGPAVDGELRPVDADGVPFDGVHCVGELLGMGQFSGDNFAGGMSVGPALSLGRWVVRMLHERDAFR